MFRLIVSQIIFLLYILSGNAQTISITGKIVNADTEEALPFANVSTIQSKIGTATNGDGNFNLIIKTTDLTDTLLFSFIGFESIKKPIESLTVSDNIIMLKPSTETLEEFVLSPLNAYEFMKRVVEEIPNNLTENTFAALGYYSDKAKENEGYLGQNEAVIKSYFPNFSDTTKQNQHQVVLYNERKDLAKLKFMAKKLKKEEAKAKEDLAEKGNDSTEVNFMDPRTMFGGLESVMSAMYIDGTNEFLDTNKFKKYEFRYHDKPIYSESGEEITLIHAKTKRRVDGFKAEGKIYINRNSLAIIKMEFKGDMKIPILLKPILFVMGIGIKNPELHYARSYQEIEGKWYPKDIYYTVKLNLIEKHIFKKNVNSLFNLQQVYSIQDIDIENPKQIEKKKRYSDQKTLAEQVFKDSNIHWNQINKVQF